MGPTKAQKFQDKGVVVLSRRGLRVLVPFIGLLLPEDVDFRELAENIALANPDVLDAKTMDAVLKGVVKDIWFDTLPCIRRRSPLCSTVSKRAYSLSKTSLCCIFPGISRPTSATNYCTHPAPQQYGSLQVPVRLDQASSARTSYSWTCGGFRQR